MTPDPRDRFRRVGAAMQARAAGDPDLGDIVRRATDLQRRRRRTASVALLLPLALVVVSLTALPGRRPPDPEPPAAPAHLAPPSTAAARSTSGPPPAAPGAEVAAPPSGSAPGGPEPANDAAQVPPPPVTAQSGNRPTIASLVAGGNLDLTDGEDLWRAKFAALAAAGVTLARVNVYAPDGDWTGSVPDPGHLDGLMALAHEHGIRPLLLFSYYDPAYGYGDQRLGGYDTWFEVGQAYAQHLRPGGDLAGRLGADAGWGATVYQAISTPDTLAKTPPADYVAALEGLADGVHAVDPALDVVAGGLHTVQTRGDPTLAGYGPALAPLLNDGTLDGLDLHNFNDARHAPVEGGYEHSAQDNFDEVKRASRITADINHYASAWGYRRDEPGTQPGQAARGTLTAFWDNLGVVGADGATGVSRLALPWNILNTEQEDAAYGMNTGLSPWEPNESGRALQAALEVAGDLHFVALDPKGAGTYVLEGGGKKLWVWQNRQGWTDQPGRVFAVTGIPAGATTLEVHGWDGLRQTVAVDGRDEVTFEDLPVDETLMFLARSGA